MKKNKVADLAIKIALMLAAFGLCYYIGYGRKKVIDVKLRDNTENYYMNPSTINDIGDPFVMKASDGFYYLYATSAEDGFLCWKSANLVDWSEPVKVFTADADSWAEESFWAPEVVEFNGTYYMFYTAKGGGYSLRIGVATSDSPAGPFVDALGKPLFDLGYAAIDANVFVDEDGQKYLYFSRDCSENKVDGVMTSQIYGVRLSDDLLSIEGEPVLLLTPEQDWELRSESPLWNEGPEMIKHDGTYYLTYSGNCYADREYSVGYAASQEPLGGFVKYENNPVLTAGKNRQVSGTGHAGFAWSPDGTELFMIYHDHVVPDQGGNFRQMAMDRVVFEEDGTLTVNGPTLYFQPIPAGIGRTNLADSMQITLGEGTSAQEGSGTKLLNDGVFAVTEADDRKSLILSVNSEGRVEFTMSPDAAKRLSSIVVYCGNDADLDFGSVEIMLDDDLRIADATLPTMAEDRSLRLNFDEVLVEKISFSFVPKEGKTNISLSEIMIFGEEG